jgi:hypothetical protein
VAGPNGEVPSDTDELIERHLDEVMDELVRLDAGDPSIDLDLTQSEARLAVLVEAVNPLEATDTASGLIRSAIHAANGSTPDWPGPHDKAWSVQLLSLSTEPVPIKVSEELVST